MTAAWQLNRPETKTVILSGAKDLMTFAGLDNEILRCAQNDKMRWD